MERGSRLCQWRCLLGFIRCVATLTNVRCISLPEVNPLDQSVVPFSSLHSLLRSFLRNVTNTLEVSRQVAEGKQSPLRPSMRTCGFTFPVLGFSSCDKTHIPVICKLLSEVRSRYDQHRGSEPGNCQRSFPEWEHARCGGRTDERVRANAEYRT